ncbi:MAG TPA: carboxypeptidase regulatory-like domain-containing protein, partial [Blastocatellia bacterium]|nr:carboxypeptidase regulatory-like domain-containing protein [Blastocatellia bacterium]
MTRNLCRPLTRSGLAIAMAAIGLFNFGSWSDRSAVRAQTATATLSGTVYDESGAVVPGVSISVTNEATQIKREVVTGKDGLFSFPLLNPGRYTVDARRDGFIPVKYKNISLEVGDQLSLRVELKVGAIGETVTIEEGVTLVRDDATVGTVINREFVENLPLNGRSFQSLIGLTPGVVLTKTSPIGEQGQFSVNGQRPDANYFTIDGVSANIGISGGLDLGQTGGGATPGLSAFGGTNNLVSVDALQEFRIQTSTFAPEFGRTPGGQISIVTRSGTNAFHGTLFEYFRNDALDANDWFANALDQPRPPLRQNLFGGVIGGPVVKNRTFFFFSYEGLRLRQPQTAVTDVPSLLARQTAPERLQPFLKAFPLPNGPDRVDNDGLPTGLAQFASSYSNPSSMDAAGIRADHAIGRGLNLWGRYNYAPSEVVQRGGGVSSLNTLDRSRVTTHTFTAGSTWIIAPTVINDLRVNWSRNTGNSALALDDFGGAALPSESLLFPQPFSSRDANYSFTVNEGTATRLAIGQNVNNVQRQINLVESLSLARTPHQIKFGVDYRRLSPIYGPRRYQQTPTFNSIGLPVPGRPTATGTVFSGIAAAVGISSSDPLTLRSHNLSSYAQDTWKISPRLTLAYGLRWEINPPPVGLDGRDLFTITGLENPATITLAPRGTPLYRTTYNNLAPRIGVAYQLSTRQGRETTLRGGFGIFHDLGTGVVANAASTFPYARLTTLRSATYPLDPALAQPIPFTLTPAGRISMTATDMNLKLPYTLQWNVSLQQSAGSNQAVTASYVGAIGRRLLRQEQIRNPNPVFQSVSFTRNTATSDYHALQLQFQRRLSGGLQALASYTWSKSLDIASNDTFILARSDLTNVNQDRGPSDFDVRHSFSAAVTYQFPAVTAHRIGARILGNWSVDAIVSARSAAPINIIAGFNSLFGVFSVARPDLINGVPLYLDDPNAAGGRVINPRAFALPPTGRQGTLGRNVVRGFPASQVDLALRRQFNLIEQLKLQFRVEVFN